MDYPLTRIDLDKIEWVTKVEMLQRDAQEEERKKRFSDEISLAMKKEIEASLHGDLW